MFWIGSVHLYTEPFVSYVLPYYQSSFLEKRQLLVPVPPEYCIFKMASLCYYVSLNPMVQHFLPFQIVTVAVFRAFLYFLYLLTIPDSEIRKENREEDLKETRRDRPIFKKRLSTMTNVSFLISSCSNEPK